MRLSRRSGKSTVKKTTKAVYITDIISGTEKGFKQRHRSLKKDRGHYLLWFLLHRNSNSLRQPALTESLQAMGIHHSINFHYFSFPWQQNGSFHASWETRWKEMLIHIEGMNHKRSYLISIYIFHTNVQVIYKRPNNSEILSRCKNVLFKIKTCVMYEIPNQVFLHTLQPNHSHSDGLIA